VLRILDASRPEYALAFSEATISLLKRERHGSWQRLDSAPTGSGHLRAALAEMRRSVPGDGAVHLFLPPEHVLSIRLTSPQEIDVAAQLAARAGCAAEDLAVVHWRQPATGQRLAMAADRTTIAEAVSHAASWGFRPLSVGVHPDTVPDGTAIRFPASLPRRRGAPLPLAAAMLGIVALGSAALGVAVSWPLGDEGAGEQGLQTVIVAADASPNDTEGLDGPGPASLPLATRLTAPGDIEALRSLAAPVPAQMPPMSAPGPVRHAALMLPPTPTPPGSVSRAMQASRDEVSSIRIAALSIDLATAAAMDRPRLPLRATYIEPPIRLAALTAAEAPSIRDARPQLSLDLASPPATEADTDAATANAPVITDAGGELDGETPAAPMRLDGPRMPAPALRPHGLVTAEWRALASAPRAPKPLVRPVRLAQRAIASRRARSASTAESGQAAAIATISRSLAADDAGLLGIITTGNRREAIVILADGQIARVSHGDTVGGWTVATVSEEYVRLTGSGERRTLRLIGR
jgi:hypothetical protein